MTDRNCPHIVIDRDYSARIATCEQCGEVRQLGEFFA